MNFSIVHSSIQVLRDASLKANKQVDVQKRVVNYFWSSGAADATATHIHLQQAVTKFSTSHSSLIQQPYVRLALL